MQAGLREQKKAYTREAIALAAWSLFQQQGVAATSIRQIAELASVAERTLCNHFPTKADLVVAALDIAQPDADLIFDVHRRPPGEHPVTAIRRGVAEGGERMTDADARAFRKLLAVTRRDPDLRAAYLRQLDRSAGLLATSMTERGRAHGLDELSLLTAVVCCLNVIDVVGGGQPARTTAAAWMRQIDGELARVERGWVA